MTVTGAGAALAAVALRGVVPTDALAATPEERVPLLGENSAAACPPSSSEGSSHTCVRTEPAPAMSQVSRTEIERSLLMLTRTGGSCTALRPTMLRPAKNLASGLSLLAHSVTNNMRSDGSGKLFLGDFWHALLANAHRQLKS